MRSVVYRKKNKGDNQMTTLERVARAICIASGLDPDKSTFSKICHGERIWHLFEDQAQAAIDTMNEWSEIADAPFSKDVLVYRPTHIQLFDVMRRNEAGNWRWPNGEIPLSDPEKWMPLPGPPK